LSIAMALVEDRVRCGEVRCCEVGAEEYLSRE
jgi:hypothetical protein